MGTEVIPEVKQKIDKIKLARHQTIDPILISANGATKSLKESEFFSDIISLEDFF